MSNDPNSFIYDYFSEIKAKIDQTKEEFIQKIELQYDKLIQILIKEEKKFNEIDPKKTKNSMKQSRNQNRN